MPTSKNTWKDLERRICKQFGGKRNPLSGQNSGHGTGSDCIETKYPEFYLEIRLRENWLHHTMFRDDVEKPAKKEGKIPILITHKKNAKSGALVVLRLEDFLELVKNQNKTKNTNQKISMEEIDIKG